MRTIVPPTLQRRALVLGTIAGMLGAPMSTATASNPSGTLRPSATIHSQITTESSQVLPAWTPTASVLTAFGYGIDRRSPGALRLDMRTTSHVLLGFGIADHAELDLDLPLVVYQRGLALEAGELVAIPSGALGDLRVGAKGTILRTPRRGFGLGLAFDVTAPTGDPAALTGYGEPTYAPQVLAEQRMARGITAALNLGYIARPDRNVGGVVFGDAITYRAGVTVPVSVRHAIAAVAEIDGELGLVRGAAHPLAMRGGFRWELRSGIAFGVYGGGAPVSALGVPDVQGLLGIGFTPPGRSRRERAFEAKRPSLVAAAHRHERWIEAVTPEAEAPADPAEVDSDRDGIADAMDLCATAPEIINGYLDADGCPDRRLADGSGETFEQFDARHYLPRLAFVDGSADPTPDDVAALERLAELLRLNAFLQQVALHVFVRPTGNPKDDRALGQARADAVAAFLVARGVARSRIVALPPKAVPGDADPQVRFAVRVAGET